MAGVMIRPIQFENMFRTIIDFSLPPKLPAGAGFEETISVPCFSNARG